MMFFLIYKMSEVKPLVRKLQAYTGLTNLNINDEVVVYILVTGTVTLPAANQFVKGFIMNIRNNGIATMALLSSSIIVPATSSLSIGTNQFISDGVGTWYRL
jgi:hypothetical protein